VKFYDVVKKENETLSLENKSLHEVTVIVGDEKLTLPQLREKVSQIKSDEIRTGSEKLFETHKTNWEKNEKPKQVHQESIAMLTQIMDALSKPSLIPIAQEYENLSKQVDETLNKRVVEKIDAAFQYKVETESTRKADERMKTLVNEHWPRWSQINLQPKIDDLMRSIDTDIYTFLLGPWKVRCAKCGAVYEDVKIRPSDVESLITTKYLSVDCENQSYRGLGTHEIKVTLAELLKNRLNYSTQPPTDNDNRNVF